MKSGVVLVAAAIAVAAVAWARFGPADDADALIPLINAYRGAEQQCGGKRTAALPPLAPAVALASVGIASAEESLPNALKKAGYAASAAQAVVVAGPRSARDAMGLLKERYCDVLVNPQLAEIGVSRDGSKWTLVLAQPLISGNLGDWRAAGEEVLRLINEARAKPRLCGDRKFDAAPPVQWHANLASAALGHSRDMAATSYFSHRGKGGSMVADRAEAAGYRWGRIGENIAAGQGSASQAVAAWLTSPQHCVNVMEPAFTEMGAAYALNDRSDAKIYWTQVFGAP